MKSDFIWPLVVALTGFLAKEFGDAVGIDFSVVFSNMQVEHWLVFIYLLVLGGIIVWSIMSYRFKNTKEDLRTYKVALEKYKDEDAEIANLRAIIRHQKETSSIKS